MEVLAVEPAAGPCPAADDALVEVALVAGVAEIGLAVLGLALGDLSDLAALTAATLWSFVTTAADGSLVGLGMSRGSGITADAAMLGPRRAGLAKRCAVGKSDNGVDMPAAATALVLALGISFVAASADGAVVACGDDMSVAFASGAWAKFVALGAPVATSSL
jgi:hypothetical protein